LRKKTKKE
jgi:hypothetical protein